MSKETQTQPRPTGTLGQHLAAIRTNRDLSLRDVQELTKKVVSNAYLSQIETGKIQQPSPNILHALAEVYKTSYQQLMELAGYIVSKHTPDATHGRAATFAALHLSEAEERELIEYVKWKRQMRDKAGEAG